MKLDLVLLLVALGVGYIFYVITKFFLKKEELAQVVGIIVFILVLTGVIVLT